MVTLLATFIIRWLKELLELGAVVAIAAAAGIWGGWGGVLVVIGIALFLKSVEVEMLQRAAAAEDPS